MRGVDTVISTIQGFVGAGGVTPASVDRDGNIHLVDAARSIGAAFVLMSVVGAAPESPLELCRMKYAAEEYLRTSGLAWSIIRATAFLETWIGLLERTAKGSGRPVVFGDGDNPIKFVSVADVATLVERVVLEPSSGRNTFEISGPENLTLNQLASAVQRAAKRTSQPRHVPRPLLKLMSFLLRPLRTRTSRDRSGRPSCSTRPIWHLTDFLHLKRIGMCPGPRCRMCWTSTRRGFMSERHRCEPK